MPTTPNQTRQHTSRLPQLLLAIIAVLTGLFIGTAQPASASTNKPNSGINVGNPINGFHTWGTCVVRDYDGGPYGRLILTNAGWVVRAGMLWGWFDLAGAPGKLGCPTSDEYATKLAAVTGVRQDFQRGSLFWTPGQLHAVEILDDYPLANWTPQNGKYNYITADDSSRGFGIRNCTDFMAFRMARDGHPVPFGAKTGNAKDWATNLSKRGWTKTSSPSVGVTSFHASDPNCATSRS